MKSLMVVLLALGCSHEVKHGLRPPVGFSAESDPSILKTMPIGGYAFVEDKRPSVEDPFLASIVVVPIKDNSVDLSDHACTTIGQVFGRRAHVGIDGALSSSSVNPSRQSCQITGHALDKDTVGVVYTVIRAHGAVWGVTCNSDVRDAAAAAACHSFLLQI